MNSCVESMVCGYHIYRDIWSASLDEELVCEGERDNFHDPFAMAVVHSEVTFGYIPRKISSVCTLFPRRGGTIICKVTSSRCYSEDLPQGSLHPLGIKGKNFAIFIFTDTVGFVKFTKLKTHEI